MKVRELVGFLLVVPLLACSSREPASSPEASSASDQSAAAPAALSASSAEEAIRSYYRSLKLYDYDAMRAAATPDYEITYGGLQLGLDDFETRHREEEKLRGPTSSRPERMKYELVDFRTEVTPDVAISTSREVNPAGNNYFNLIVLKRSEDRWLIHRFFHMPDQPPPSS